MCIRDRLYFDLNNFKKINDNFGHAEGDRVLRAFAEALLHIFRGSDVIGRIGGDEFVVLLTNAGKNKTSAIVARMKERIEMCIRDRRHCTTVVDPQGHGKTVKIRA